ncbi:hypothetical protein HYT56_01550 [Candidatus Woesearchaeota archaeon]|nr:hypothetical protein [Candidatus Woesearchaeota archaeon]
MIESVKEDLENKVIVLQHDGSFELPETYRATDKFIVVNDTFFAYDFYGDVNVFNLRNGRQISLMKFNFDSLKSMATDGDHVYFHTEKDWETIEDKDILIARCDPELRGVEGVTCDFVGKSVRELNRENGKNAEYIHNDPKENKYINGMIFSIPFNSIVTSSLIYSPVRFSENFGPRFLIHSDMSMPRIISRNGYVDVGYNYHFGGMGCDTSFRLKNSKIENIIQADLTENRDLELHFRWTNHIGIVAYTPIYNENAMYSDERITDHFLPVVFKGRNIGNYERILKMQHSLDDLHIFYEDCTSSNARGAFRVIDPARLESYKISVKDLE